MVPTARQPRPTHTPTPTPLTPPPGIKVIGIAAGAQHGMALLEDGTVWVWGDNTWGELGIRAPETLIPVQVGDLNNLIDIGAGLFYSVALSSDGVVWAWGSNHKGDLGLGVDSEAVEIPTPVQDIPPITTLDVGELHTLVIDEAGHVWAWGNNRCGQLGDGTTENRNSPVRVMGLDRIIAVAAGSSQSLALRDDGTVWAWGANRSGKLGLGYFDESDCGEEGSDPAHLTPTQIPTLSNIVSIAAGASSVAVQDNGTIWRWGQVNYEDQGVADVGVFHSATPLQVAELPAISAADAWSATILAGMDGTLWMWGYISKTFAIEYGYSQPVQLEGPTNVIAVSAGDLFALALTQDGEIWGWGQNKAGQLGDGTTETRDQPVRVALFGP